MILQTNDFSSALYGTLGALVAGTILKLINKILERRSDQLTEHTILRKELREELDTVKEELCALQTALDEWKQKYYHQVEITNTLQMDVLKLTDELTEYKRISGIHPTDTSGYNGWFDTQPKKNTIDP
jgi:vacuolar-type H+-ATPase subunit I/STV1